MLSGNVVRDMGMGYTFSVDPEKRTRCHPFVEYASLKEPCRCSLVMGITRNVMVCGRVWWGEPFMNALSQLVP